MALGVAAIPAVSYSTGAGRLGATSTTAMAKRHKPAKRCRKGQARKNRRCVKKGSPSGPVGKTVLRIVYTNRHGFEQLNYTLRCHPAAGTIADPAAACAEVSRHPGMVFEGVHGDHSCPPSSSLSVDGKYDGRKVNVTFSPCGFGDGYQGNWERFLPTEAEENEVSIDRAVGPFALGEARSSLEALLARTPDGNAGGLYVYSPWRFIAWSCATRGGGQPGPAILAIRYNRAGRVITVIANQHTLTIDGQEIWSLLVRCPHFEEPEEVSRSEGPFSSWLPVTCGGREALADHPLSEGSAGQDTTLVVPGGESGQFPLVILTSDPTSACEDAARLQSEWGT